MFSMDWLAIHVLHSEEQIQGLYQVIGGESILTLSQGGGTFS